MQISTFEGKVSPIIPREKPQSVARCRYMTFLTKSIAAFAAAYLLICAGAGAQNIPHPPIEAYGSLPSTEDVALSPNGNIVALIKRQGEQAAVIKVDLRTKEVTPVGSIGEMKVFNLFFLDNNTLIIRLSKTRRTFGYRGKFEASGSVAVNMTTGKIIGLLSKTKNLHPAQSGLGRIVGHNPETDTIYMPGYSDKGTLSQYDLWGVSAKTGRGKRAVRGTTNTIDWLVAPDGTVLAREDLDDNKNVYSIQTKITGKWTKVLELEDQALVPFSIMGVMPNQSGLVVVAEGDKGDNFLKLDWDGNFSPLNIGLPNKNIDHIFRDKNRTIQGVRYSGIRPSYHFMDEQLNEYVQSFVEQFPYASAEIVSHDKAWNRIIYHVFDGHSSGVYLIHDRTKDSLERIGYAYSDIPPEAIAAVDIVEYQNRDNTTIEALLTWPVDSTAETRNNLPMIMMPHGGPAAYDALRFDWMAQYFANRGYAVLQPNFRGSDGYGAEFREAGYGQWGTGMQDDLTDGLDAMVAAGFADPSRICIVGASYGGYAALAGGAFTPEKYACVAAIAPVADLRKFITWVGKRHGKNDSSVDYWKDSIGNPKSERGKLENASPTESAETFTAPVLLIHGDDDTVVPITQTYQMNTALKAADKSVKMVKLKGGDHWLAERETRIQTLKELDEFISEHLN